MAQRTTCSHSGSWTRVSGEKIQDRDSDTQSNSWRQGKDAMYLMKLIAMHTRNLDTVSNLHTMHTRMFMYTLAKTLTKDQAFLVWVSKTFKRGKKTMFKCVLSQNKRRYSIRWQLWDRANTFSTATRMHQSDLRASRHKTCVLRAPPSSWHSTPCFRSPWAASDTYANTRALMNISVLLHQSNTSIHQYINTPDTKRQQSEREREREMWRYIHI